MPFGRWRATVIRQARSSCEREAIWSAGSVGGRSRGGAKYTGDPARSETDIRHEAACHHVHRALSAPPSTSCASNSRQARERPRVLRSRHRNWHDIAPRSRLSGRQRELLVLRTDAETVTALAAVDWNRYFRRVCLDPARGLITLMSPSFPHEDFTQLLNDIRDLRRSARHRAERCPRRAPLICSSLADKPSIVPRIVVLPCGTVTRVPRKFGCGVALTVRSVPNRQPGDDARRYPAATSSAASGPETVWARPRRATICRCVSRHGT